MSILVDKNTKVITQGMPGDTGTALNESGSQSRRVVPQLDFAFGV